MTLKANVNDLHFQYQLRVSKNACFVQTWWLQFKFVSSYRADKDTFTDRHNGRATDRWADAGSDNIRLAWVVKG